MYLPQIWCVRIHTEARLPLYPAIEYCQREDIRFYLVLVHHFGDTFDWIIDLSVSFGI